MGRKQEEFILLEKLLNNIGIANLDVSCSLTSLQIMNDLERKGEKINLVDVFIAPIAVSNNLTLVTLDKDFNKIDKLKVNIFLKKF